ncbi:hypothetical protein [Methylocystis echinoides]|uniref:hypothetical protein n=1 Tax=Methylocystis echinoides TaxID=29468 RepID=UPI003448DAF2
MPSPKLSLVAQTESSDALVIQHALGVALRFSHARIAEEALPRDFALLLMRLALAEVVKSTPEDEGGGQK